MNKTLKLYLGGKERTLLFGKAGFWNHIAEASGIDPLEWLNKLSEQKGIISNIKDVAIIVFAGLNTYADNEDTENVDLTKVGKWVNGLEQEEMVRVVTFAFESLPKGEMAEEEKKTAA